jgi:hypothetical protein
MIIFDASFSLPHLPAGLLTERRTAAQPSRHELAFMPHSGPSCSRTRMTGWSRADSTQPQWLILKRTVPGYAPARSCKASAGRSSSSSSKLQFTARVYYPGRRVRIAYNYNLALHPTLMATVKRFEVALASVHPRRRALWPVPRTSGITSSSATAAQESQACLIIGIIGCDGPGGPPGVAAEQRSRSRTRDQRRTTVDQ